MRFYMGLRPRLLGACLLLGWMPWVWGSASASGESEVLLKHLFELAWAHQPEARALPSRQEAAQARRAAADSWTSSPAALELSSKGDQLYGKGGIREDVVGVAVPLWLLGEREGTGHLADAEQRVVQSQAHAARLRTAAQLRDAYWQWQRARAIHGLALERQHNFQQLVHDVARRVKQGDQARVDLLQAESTFVQAQGEAVAAESQVTAAAQTLRALTGRWPESNAPLSKTPHYEPLPPDFSLQETRHPTLQALSDQAEVARRTQALAKLQTRANPELTLSTTHERGGSGSRYQDSLTVGIRIPLGSDSRNRAKQAAAEAELLEAEAQQDLSRQRAEAGLESARQQWALARTQWHLADQRHQLTQETRRLFERAFELGQTDWPNRLRVERDAIEARQQAVLAQINAAAATSTLRQALGLLPE